MIVYRHRHTERVISYHTSMHVHVYACTLAVGSAPLNTLVLWSSYHRDIKLFGALFSSSILLLLSCAISIFSFFFLAVPQRYRLATPINILHTNFHALNNDQFRILTKAINNCDDTIKVRLPFFLFVSLSIQFVVPVPLHLLHTSCILLSVYYIYI